MENQCNNTANIYTYIKGIKSKLLVIITFQIIDRKLRLESQINDNKNKTKICASVKHCKKICF